MKINPNNLIFAVSGRFGKNTYQIRGSKGNIVFRRSYFPTGSNLTTQAMIAKYNSLSAKDLEKWRKIALEHKFWSQYQAFGSSFFLYVKKYGLAKAIVDDITYQHSDYRIEKAKKLSHNVSQLLNYAELKKTLDDSKALLKSENKTLKYFCITPYVSSTADIDQAEILDLVVPSDGFGTGAFGTGGFGV